MSRDFPSGMFISWPKRNAKINIEKRLCMFFCLVHSVVCFGIVWLTGCWLVCEMATPCPLSSVQFEGSNLGTPRWKRETRRPSWTLAFAARLEKQGGEAEPKDFTFSWSCRVGAQSMHFIPGLVVYSQTQNPLACDQQLKNNLFPIIFCWLFDSILERR